MASVTTNTTTAPTGFWAVVGSFFSAIGRGIVLAGESSARFRDMRRLEAMSDSELAEMGLTRDKIAHHVFRDLYYI